jgi:hypothetical protein
MEALAITQAQRSEKRTQDRFTKDILTLQRDRNPLNGKSERSTLPQSSSMNEGEQNGVETNWTAESCMRVVEAKLQRNFEQMDNRSSRRAQNGADG